MRQRVFWSEEVRRIFSRYQYDGFDGKQDHVEFSFAHNICIEIMASQKGYSLREFWKDKEDNKHTLGSVIEVTEENLPWMMESVMYRYRGGLCVDCGNE